MAIRFQTNKPDSSSGDTADDVVISGEGELKLSAGEGTETSGDVTIDDRQVCRITTESLAVVAGETYDITLTSNKITDESLFVASIRYGTCSQGQPVILQIVPGDGEAVITILNTTAQGNSKDLDGTLLITLIILN